MQNHLHVVKGCQEILVQMTVDVQILYYALVKNAVIVTLKILLLYKEQVM